MKGFLNMKPLFEVRDGAVDPEIDVAMRSELSQTKKEDDEKDEQSLRQNEEVDPWREVGNHGPCAPCFPHWFVCLRFC